jgi:amino acid carrier protein
MKLYLFFIIIIGLGLLFNVINYNYFVFLLSISWYVASILIMYATGKFSYKYKFRQLNIKKIIEAIRSKSKNDISPCGSLSVSLAAKIGVGSLSGIALCLYFGGLGSIFWLVIISLLIPITTYVECLLGIKYRNKIDGEYVGGPSYYISKCLGNKKMGYLYSILIIITYSGLFLSIQANTIVNALEYVRIDKVYSTIILMIVSFLIIIRGIKGITKVNSILVPVMLVFYVLLGGYIVINNYQVLGNILGMVIKEAFQIKKIIPVFLVGMQRAIFITESSIGTSAISASSCDNDGDKQGMLEVFGVHIVTILVCLTTFLIISTTDYQMISFNNLNGIEIVMYAFQYHFGSFGMLFLSIITVLFAFSTIISSYFFGESNMEIFSWKKRYRWIIRIFFILVILLSSFIKPSILWNLCDYFIAILVIINVSSIIKICKRERDL